jgi:hypothetical protein
MQACVVALAHMLPACTTLHMLACQMQVALGLTAGITIGFVGPLLDLLLFHVVLIRKGMTTFDFLAVHKETAAFTRFEAIVRLLTWGRCGSSTFGMGINPCTALATRTEDVAAERARRAQRKIVVAEQSQSAHSERTEESWQTTASAEHSGAVHIDCVIDIVAIDAKQRCGSAECSGTDTAGREGSRGQPGHDVAGHKQQNDVEAATVSNKGLQQDQWTL